MTKDQLYTHTPNFYKKEPYDLIGRVNDVMCHGYDLTVLCPCLFRLHMM